MLKTVRLIHRVVGLTTGLFLAVICLTGAMIALGKVVHSYSPVFKVMYQLHRDLFIGEVGSWIIGVTTLLLLVELVTGYWLWGIGARAMIKGAKARQTGVMRAFFKSLSWRRPTLARGLHVGTGFWSGPLLALMALTGLTWSFGWYSDLVYALFSTTDTTGDDGGLFHVIAPLHTGACGGTPTRLLWIFAAILGAITAITGLIIFFKHRHARH